MWQDSWIRLWRFSAGKVDDVADLAQSELKDGAIGIAIDCKL